MLFGPRFIRFMEGFKHKGAVIRGETEKGFYDPLETKVNFAVLSDTVLNGYCPFDGIDQFKNGVPSGVINPVIEVYSSAGKDSSHILTLVGKKLIPNSANINLMGCEVKR